MSDVNMITVTPDAALTFLMETNIDDEEYARDLCKAVVQDKDLVVNLDNDE